MPTIPNRRSPSRVSHRPEETALSKLNVRFWISGAYDALLTRALDANMITTHRGSHQQVPPAAGAGNLA